MSVTPTKHRPTRQGEKGIPANESRNIVFAFLAMVGIVIFWLWIFFGVIAPWMGV